MIIKEIICKNALSKSGLPGLEYALNPYVGCMHQCVYCYAPGILHLNQKNWKTIVSVKRNLPLLLSKEIKQKKKGTIGISTVTDPYQPIENTYHVTRYCLEILVKQDFPICIQTKSDLILRDKDLISRCKNVEVMVSIGTINDKHRKILEPGSSSISQRINILKTFANLKVKTSVFFGPIYPTIKSEEISDIIDVFLDCKVDEIMIDSLHFKKEIISSLKDITHSNKEFQRYQPNFHPISYNKQFNIIRNRIYEYVKEKDIVVKDAFI
jgi:DNA repair photolyase